MNRSQNIDNCGKKKNLKENFIEKRALSMPILCTTKVEIAVKPPKYTRTSNQPVQLIFRGIGTPCVFKGRLYYSNNSFQIRMC